MVGHGSVHADIVLQEEMLHVDMQVAVSRRSHRAVSWVQETSKPAHKVAHFLQHRHTYFYEATAPIITTSYEIIGANYT